MHVNTPLITSNDCEGGGEIFHVSSPTHPNFFNTPEGSAPPSLTVSSQLHLEMAAQGLGRVYTLSPCFRADLGSEMSSRHLAEFYMLEAEWCWPAALRLGAQANNIGDQVIDGLGSICDVGEHLVKKVIQHVMDRCDAELEHLEVEVPKLNQLKSHKGGARAIQQSSFYNLPLRERLSALLSTEYIRIPYNDAYDVLTRFHKPSKSNAQRNWERGLNADQERWLVEYLMKQQDPTSVSAKGLGVFVTNYPAACKPFYMKRSQNETDDTVACTDMLLPGLGEVIGGSLREDDYETLRRRIMSQHESQVPKALEGYLDLRKYGSCPHGGFGLGFDRLMMLLTGMLNIRDVVMMGRWKGHCDY